MRRRVTSAAEHKVGVVAHLVQQVEHRLSHLIRCAVLEDAHRVDISHGQCRWGHILDNLLHAALIAEMVGSSTCRHHCLRALSRVAAIVQNDDEVVVLYLINNILDVG